jgi:calcineurin-like phosphoesterase family protein
MKRFLVADTHFGHVGVCNFLRDDGTKLRPWTNYEEMDADMVKLWNDTVGPKDTVYHLGDVVINRRALSTLSLLNGRKVLIKGNHDIFKLEDYLKYFDDIRAYYIDDNFIMSHIPIHPDSKGRFKGNIHGHLHHRRVLLPDGNIDPFYYCVSVEHTFYTPIEISKAKELWAMDNMAEHERSLGLSY